MLGDTPKHHPGWTEEPRGLVQRGHGELEVQQAVGVAAVAVQCRSRASNR